MSLLPEDEYVRFCYDLIPPRIIAYYNLDSLVFNGYVYACINRIWYGLKQGGFIANQDLVNHLKKTQLLVLASPMVSSNMSLVRFLSHW